LQFQQENHSDESDDDGTSADGDEGDEGGAYNIPALPPDAMKAEVTAFMENVKSRCTCTGEKHAVKLQKNEQQFRRICFEANQLSGAER
jgi:hypothetical protein